MGKASPALFLEKGIEKITVKICKRDKREEKSKSMRIAQYLQVKERLKSIRINADISQKEMAAKLDLSVPSYSNYENGYTEPPIEVIQKFCSIIGITEETFFGFAITYPKKDMKEDLKINKEIQCFSVTYTDGSMDVFEKIN